MSFLVIDIDYFKKINDSYGHTAGDLAIKCMADLLLGAFRKSDVIARIGGEEFVVMLDLGDSEKAFELAENLRRNTEHSPFRYDEHLIQFTISIGIASLQEEDTVETLLKRADDACYISKNNGRNQTSTL